MPEGHPYLTHPPAPSKEGELVAGLRMNQLIQTFFVPRWGAFVYPSPGPFQGRGVGRGVPDESVAMVTTGAGDFAILQ